MGKQLNVENSVISAKDDALFYNAMIQKNGVWQYGNKLDYEIISANQINIKDGMVTAQGRNYVIYQNEVDSMTIENGTVNTKRYDLIVYEVSKTSEGEQVGLKVIKGTSATTPTDPILIQENTLVSGSKYQMPLYRVRLNGINVEGVDDLREYIVSFGDLSNPNLLINGDFQCNQRGQSEYNFNTTGKYGLDMWMHRQGNFSGALIVEQVSNGVKLTCASHVFGALRQCIGMSSNCVGKNFTVGISVNDVTYKETFILSTESKLICQNDICYVKVQYDSENSYLIFSIELTSNNTRNETNIINYVDLFEGDIAYHHVKEDYATALMRCQDYIQSLVDKSVAFTRIIPFLTSGAEILFGIQYFKPMKSTPTVESYQLIDSSGKIVEATFAVTKNEIRRIDVTTSDFTKNSYAYLSELIVTCEPL